MLYSTARRRNIHLGRPGCSTRGRRSKIDTLRALSHSARVPQRVQRACGIGGHGDLRSQVRPTATVVRTIRRRARNVEYSTRPTVTPIGRLAGIEIYWTLGAPVLRISCPGEIDISQ